MIEPAAEQYIKSDPRISASECRLRVCAVVRRPSHWEDFVENDHLHGHSEGGGTDPNGFYRSCMRENDWVEVPKRLLYQRPP